MFDMSPLYFNWVQAWADCIREDGGMPHTAPNVDKAGGGPHWCGVIIVHSWNVYVNYADSRLIEKYSSVMQHWLEYVQKYTVDGLLQKWPDTDYRAWYLGDWAPPLGVDCTAKPSMDLVNNCFISICYDTMGKMAVLLGKTNDAAVYAEKRDQLRKLLHERFFDGTRNSYATSSQIDLVYPMLTQVTPAPLVPAVTQTLYTMTEQDRGGHLATGLIGLQILAEWAALNRSTDWVYGMLKKRDYPGYLYMIDNDATGTWELWEGLQKGLRNGEESWIHNCYNGIGIWFHQAIGGIRPDENFPGYRRVVIAPQVPSGVTWAKVSKETPYGTLIVDWKVKDGLFSMNLTVPPGCTALLEIPENVKDYTLDGKRYRSASNEVPSGKHHIVYRM
jgi:alpha-L-rhamnosidase